ncbi:circadian clock-controlled protein-like [Diaphorina citri]|uniref:Circadian clock-controlled protein-like n=1 Tax=Diaphorina citri TaxID=121845 RepID=A0A1S3DDF6_DIACI|nr:circadian clock-controlled protein-like [Diaphorina citri]
MTRRNIKTRTEEHIVAARNSTKGRSNYADHLIDEGHDYKKTKIEVLYKGNKYREVMSYEQIYIHESVRRNLNLNAVIDTLPSLVYATEQLIQDHNARLKELNLTGLDPVHVPELLLNYENGDIEGKMIIRDSYTHGLSSIKVLDVRSMVRNPEKFEMEVDYYLPKVRTTGVYKMDGLIGQFPVQGKGYYQVNMTDVSGTWKIKGHRVLDDTKEAYMKITDFGMRPNVGHMDINMSNLVNGNPELSTIALTFINQFWKVVYDALLPFAEEGFAKVAKPVLNKVFLSVPYEQLFPLMPAKSA